MARRYGIYILGSNDQAPFRESVDPERDRPLPRSRPPAAQLRCTWPPAPRRTTRPSCGARTTCAPRAAAAAQRRAAEQEGAAHRHRAADRGRERADRPARTPWRTCAPTGCQAPGRASASPPACPRSSTATRRPGVDPCSDTSKYYMRCLDRLGANVVMQDEANPGPWASDAPFWQPLDWMRSTWRAASDPTVHFDYNVTPHLVGHLGDLVFDGQTAITQRGLRGRGCDYVGDSRLMPAAPESDPASPGLRTPAEARIPGPGSVGHPGRAARAALRATRPSWRPAPGPAGERVRGDGHRGRPALPAPTPWRRNCISWRRTVATTAGPGTARGVARNIYSLWEQIPR